MDLTTPDRSQMMIRPLLAGWMAAFLVVGAFVLLTTVFADPSARLLAQLVFMVPVALSFAGSVAASRRARAGSRARRTWGFLAVASSFALCAEGVLALGAVRGESAASASVLFDVSAVCGVGFLVAGAWSATAFDSVGWRRGARWVFDGLALSALAVGVSYDVIARALPVRSVGADEIVRLMCLVLVGFVMLEMVALIYGSPVAQFAPWNRTLGVGLALLAVALIGWAVIMFADVDAAVSRLPLGFSVVSLAGYSVLAMSALQRLVVERRWRPDATGGHLPEWIPGVVFSSVVLVTVVWLAMLAVRAPDEASRAVFTFALGVAAVSVVARTALANAESVELDARSLTDPVTGTLGPQALDRAWEAVDAQARRRGELAALYAVDVDDFARVNADLSFIGGDRELRLVASSLERVSGADAWVVRVSGDEFLVLACVADLAEGKSLGVRLCAAVKETRGSVPLTASVGAAFAPLHAATCEELARCASAARVWAKRQGKDRIVVYDPRIGDAVSIDERLSGSLQSARDVARALLAAADARDPHSHDHARNVAALARLMATELEYEDAHAERVEIAALLHDVGKIALPNVMLGGKTLSARERLISQEHCQLGERLLEALSDPGIALWVRAHHERWDGQGYPDGLQGDAIPVEARIIALADAYDGMAAGRRYGAPMSKAAALQEIDFAIGTRFDPELAERFIVMVGTTDALGWTDSEAVR